MKKYLFIIIYILFFFWASIAILKNPSLNDIYNVFFLNIDKFEMYGLSKNNFMYPIMFSFFTYFVTYFLLNEIHENISFMQLIFYRKGRKQTIKEIIIKNIKNIVVMCILFFVTTIINFEIIKKGMINNIIQILSYTIRYFLVIYIYTIIYERLVFVVKSSNATFIISVLIILNVVIDMLTPLNIITYTGVMQKEVVLLILSLLLSIFITSNTIYKIKKIGDIL